MSRECIRFRSKEGVRNVVVIDGQPYYQSTGLNSDMPGRWFPFIVLIGSYENNWQFLPKIHDPSRIAGSLKKCRYDLIPGYIVKVMSFNLSAAISEKDKNSAEFNKKTRKRIPLKKFLVISSQLNPESYTDQELSSAGLNESEIKSARQRIELRVDSEKFYQNPDKINAWLLAQGAHYIADVVSDVVSDAVSDAVSKVVSKKSRKLALDVSIPAATLPISYGSISPAIITASDEKEVKEVREVKEVKESQKPKEQVKFEHSVSFIARVKTFLLCQNNEPASPDSMSISSPTKAEEKDITFSI